MSLQCMWRRRQLERLADVEGVLTADSALARHVESCHGCRNAWRQLTGLAAGLRQSLEVSPSSAVTAQEVWARIGDVAPQGRRVRWAPVLGAGAALAIALAVVLNSGASRRPAGPSSAGRQSPPPAPQVAPGVQGPIVVTAPTAVATAGPTGAAAPRRSERKEQDEPRALASDPRRDRPPLDRTSPEAVTPDTEFLDGRSAEMLARWGRLDSAEERRMADILSRLSPPVDDFVDVPLPRLAAAADQRAVVSKALQDYEKEAKVTDPRLYRQVSLEVKGEALSDVCERLKALTGVQLRASRGVADEKVTIFVKEQRARNLMRAVARLFGYTWSRGGEAGAYRYELVQDLKSQLAEEELRNRDLNAALLSLDATMAKMAPYAELDFDELVRRRKQQPRDRELLNLVYGAGWGGLQLYQRLTPLERAALVSGQELILRPDHPNPEHRLPTEWQSALIRSWNSNVRIGDQRVPIAEVPGIKVGRLGLRLNRSELGQVSLSVSVAAGWREGGGMYRLSTTRELAVGKSPSAESPQNAMANAALRGRPPFDRMVSLEPEPSCPHFRAGAPANAADGERSSDPVERDPHVASADVWEAVHRATGLPVVADSYSKLHLAAKLRVKDQSLFDALNLVSDRMGVRWTKDADCVLGRSTSYLWDKLKEVPNRHLRRWSQHQEAQGGLPLEDFLEMANLTDQQLNSRVVGDVVRHCWDLRAWLRLMGEDSYGRYGARLLSSFPPALLLQALQADGIPFANLPLTAQQDVLELHQVIMQMSERQGSQPVELDQERLKHAVFRARYVPAGWYQWNVPLSTPQTPLSLPLLMSPVAGRDAKEVLAAARRLHPPATEDQIERVTNGDFHAGLTFVYRAQ